MMTVISCFNSSGYRKKKTLPDCDLIAGIGSGRIEQYFSGPFKVNDMFVFSSEHVIST